MDKRQLNYIKARQSQDARDGIVFTVCRGACPMTQRTLSTGRMTNATYERMVSALENLHAELSVSYDGGEIVVLYDVDF